MGLRFCSLASGSSGNCQYLETDKVRILIDAGLSGRKIENSLLSIGVNPSTIDCILVTHEHRDHIKGVGILSRRFNLPIYANTNTWKSMKKDIGDIDEDNIRVFKTGSDFELGDLGILPFELSHDANEPVGYCFYYRDKKLSIVTDTGCIKDKVKETIKKSNLLMIEANHDIEMLKMGKYPWFLKKRIMGDFGHLSNETAGRLVCEILEGKRETILLGHLSKENNFPELAYQTVANIMKENGISIDEDVILNMTYRDKPSKVYCFD